MTKMFALKITRASFQAIMAHLLPKNTKNEQAAFVYARAEDTDGNIQLHCIEWEPVEHEDFAHHSEYHIELRDQKRAQIIKRAHDLKASLVEWHSHPSLWPAEFSLSDLAGFDEFVPHAMWRLDGRPYLAIVVTPFDFDALIWADNSENACPLNFLKVGSRNLIPTGLTHARRSRKYAEKI